MWGLVGGVVPSVLARVIETWSAGSVMVGVLFRGVSWLCNGRLWKLGCSGFEGDMTVIIPAGHLKVNAGTARHRHR